MLTAVTRILHTVRGLTILQQHVAHETEKSQKAYITVFQWCWSFDVVH